jgi:cAMP-dependent protein kinase regulator
LTGATADHHNQEMLRRDAKIELIGRAPLFAGCSRRELARVASIADEIELPAGKVLTTQGRHEREFFVLLDGTAEVQHDGRVVNRLGAGDFFGEIGLLTRAARTATVTTTTPVSALVITAGDFRALLRHSPQLQLQVIDALAARLAD